MNSEEQQEILNEQHVQPENGPGHLLAKKREALGISVQEVADALHITMHYVRALETDAHDKLPGDVFIKGYLRSYASLLQLDPTVIVNVYLEYNSDKAHAQSESGTRRHSVGGRRIPWIVVSGVAFVVVAIALWFFNSGSTSPVRPAATAPAVNASNVTTRTLRSGVAPTLDEVATTVVVPSVPEQLAEPAPSATLEELTTPQNATGQAVTVPAEVDAVDGAPVDVAPVDETPSADTSQEEADLPVGTTAQEAASSERLISVDGGGADLVQFTFTGQSMVQVTDAHDEQLYRDVRVAGDLLRISGTAPFNILLGDASNSELSFNGDKVDFDSSIRIDNSARLTIGL